tara:strand:+ start:3029 stop:3841 length:813 start_codon:yes stop_codon:yes gene_type:complete
MAIIIDKQVSVGLGGCDGSQLLWENKGNLTGATYATDAPVSDGMEYLFDYLSTSYFQPENIATFSVTTTFTTPQICNSVCMAGVNFRSSYVVAINVYDEVDTLVHTEITTATANNKPLFALFDDYNFNSIRVEFVLNIPTGVPFVSTIITNLYFGKTLEFPGQPDVGYQPGKWNNSRKTETFKSQNNAFGRNITTELGTEENANFSFIPYEFMDEFYVDFVAQYAAWPVFFAWDKKTSPEDVIFGNVKLGKASFTTGIHSSISLKFDGII